MSAKRAFFGPATILAAALFGPAPTLGAEPGHGGELVLTLATGYDTNPLRLSGREAGAFYAEGRCAASGRLSLGGGVSLFATGGASARAHERAAGMADASYGDLKAGLRWSNRDVATRRIDLAVGGRVSASRGTFTDRATGEVYASGPALLGDRFDADTAGGFVEARWSPLRRLRLQVGAERENRNYVDDYASVAGIDPLDSSAWTVTPRLRVLVSEAVALEIGADWTSRAYEALPAVDSTGAAVAGTARRERGTSWRIAMDARPSARWDISAGVVAGGRRDLHAGYYDTEGKSAYLLAGLKAGRLNRVQLYLSAQDLEYLQATLANDPAGPNRGSDVVRALARFERRLGADVVLTTEAGLQRTDSADPLYAYDRDWIQTALRFKR